MTFSDLASVPSDPPALFTDQLRLAGAAYLAMVRSVPPGRLDRDGAGELPADDERGPARWTLDALARAARDAGIGVGRSQVRRILLAEKVRWRRTRSRATGTDPESALKGPASWSSAPRRRRAPR